MQHAKDDRKWLVYYSTNADCFQKKIENFQEMRELEHKRYIIYIWLAINFPAKWKAVPFLSTQLILGFLFLSTQLMIGFLSCLGFQTGPFILVIHYTLKMNSKIKYQNYLLKNNFQEKMEKYLMK